MFAITHDVARKIVSYCSEEVRRQGDGPLEVGNMVNAWLYAIEQKANGADLSLGLISEIGMKVKPSANPNGYRRIPIYVGNEQKAPPDEIVGRLERWLELLPNMTPLQAYIEFEEIHPFRDGNGRTGKIILNWLNDTITEPIFPPKDIWGYPIENP